MIKSRRLLSFAVAVFMVFSMFSFVYADPSGWVATGYIYPGVLDTNSAGFNWRYKADEMQIDFNPAAYSGGTSNINIFYSYFGKSKVDNGSKVVCSYLGNSQFPDLRFKGNNNYEYNFVFDSSMSNVVSLKDVTVTEMSVETTKNMYVFLDGSFPTGMPCIDTNNSKYLCVTVTGYENKKVNIGESYSGDVDFEIRKSSVLQEAYIDPCITKIPDRAFYEDTALNYVDIPDSVTSIEYAAFYKNTSLKEIHIPKSVKTIRPDAFEDSALKDIYYDGTKKDWNEINIYETYFDENDVPWITFDGLLSKQAITVHCSDGNITLPARKYNNVTYDGSCGYCAQTGGLPGFTWYCYDDMVFVEVGARYDTIPYTQVDDFLTELDENSWYLELRKNPEYIGALEFEPKSETGKKVDAMIDVFIADTPSGCAYVTLDFLTTPPEIIGSGSGYMHSLKMKNVNCTKLPDVDTNEAGYYYVEFGKYLSSTIEFRDVYDDIGVNFSNKDKIEKAIFDEGIKTIASPCLKDSKNLKEVILPSTVETIEYLSFSNCDSLQKISIPKSVKTIHDTAFAGNAKFTDIYYEGTKAEWEKIKIEMSTTNTPKLDFEQEVVIHCKDGDIYTKKSETGSKTFEDFVERLYTVALDRASEPEGKAFWCEHVGNGDLTGAQCANEFLLSQEFKDRGLTDEQFLTVLYSVFFDRKASDDPDGFNFWMNSLKTQGRDVVVDCFINSTEWCNVCATYGVKSGATRAKATIASENAKKFATRLYTECLGREPETEGLNFWALGLTNLELTGSQAAHEFFFCKEFNDHNFDNKELITRMYKTFMGREPDDDGMAFWLDSMSKGATKQQVFDSFVKSPEFTQICKECAIERG